jgi:hypothetical protein
MKLAGSRGARTGNLCQLVVPLRDTHTYSHPDAWCHTSSDAGAAPNAAPATRATVRNHLIVIRDS